MKVQFHRPDAVQEQVTAAQEEMRTRSPRRLQILRTLIVLAVIAAAAWGGYQYFTRKTIYAYGIVSGDTQEIAADIQSTLSELAVRRGDFVNKGDVVATTEPAEQNRLLSGAIDRLRKARDTRTSLVEQRAALAAAKTSSKNVPVTMGLATITRQLQEKKAAVAIKQSTRRHEIEQALIEQEHNTAKIEQAEAECERIKRLLALDAAIKADVTRAQKVLDTLLFEQKQAANRARFLKESDKTAREEEQKEIALLEAQRREAAALAAEKYTVAESESRRDIDSLDRQIALLEKEIKAAEEHLAGIRERLVGREVRALFDGVVTDVFAARGTTLLPGQRVMKIVSTENMWIDGYIPLSKSILLKKKDTVRIHTDLVQGSLTGTLLQKEGAVVKTPALLQDRLPGDNTVKLVRISVKDITDLKPGNIVKIVLK